jgi:hypothetical protein
MPSEKNAVVMNSDAPAIQGRPDVAAPDAPPALATAKTSKRDRLAGTIATTTIKLLPLLDLLDRIRPHVENESVFTSRREKIKAQMAIVHEQLHADQPKHEAIAQAFKSITEFVWEESREVSKDEVKESAKRFVLVAVKTAPELIRAAHTAGLFTWPKP